MSQFGLVWLSTAKESKVSRIQSMGEGVFKHFLFGETSDYYQSFTHEVKVLSDFRKSETDKVSISFWGMSAPVIVEGRIAFDIINFINKKLC